MTACVMWCNGFLQNLDFDLAGPGSGGRPRARLIAQLRHLNPFSTPPITRIVARRSGRWLVEIEPGEQYDVHLMSGWVIGGGWCIGLYWKSDEGRRFRCWIAGWRQDPAVLRRLLVRMKMPV